ncbi:hypothetical protein [Spartinivicinus poritis]|uniref:Uncharacterized protein n=1 Tax=Spartinivicinus poritis TaxID=2994640 RepID=A0ABT5U7Z2_9GAMM|nr:hypothetical protein [Spartinivicinus sp. A2-2]MDE1462498.1 hypothetical protein [Spartinivicinus sp. A2-2]
MKFFKIIVLILFLGGIYHYWDSYRDEPDRYNSNAFIPVVMPNETIPNHVMILAPLNCPEEEGRRAQELSEQLTQLGIPNKIIDSVSFRSTQEQKIKQTVKLLNSKVPVVLFNELGQSNPSTDMVVATYVRYKMGLDSPST